ncbi:TatD family hydrolase [Bordetella holmesii]|uniref:Hydrolase, TatD family n=3 Tax=Bordetella holmesii TaxID=35814 RepID=A0A158M505_9BORD|nr:TatD family hydrolase [Bordetella holmesii]AHV91990.1 tatD related DNase family protein [Bordetella holmesii ATCC 51541]EWM41313.1 tatD related DNase family protein [Bordetella holmesii 35009]EWM42235.1 tatD related DNase family protein [Bordetella holmesii 41130]EWM45208.1 tatD related DNase family protein [Bordetella holmesii 70147]AMD47407.1 DNAase [Bordetella holmesii H558]
MLIDTHCHLDAAEFDADRLAVARQAYDRGVKTIVIPAVERANFSIVRDLAHGIQGGAYALGIHPLYVGRASQEDLVVLRQAVEAAMPDPRFVAIGEIGLDFFVPDIASGEPRMRQEHFYAAQLALAAEFGLPVLLHVRRSQDILLKYLRRQRGSCGGIAHAFNGSAQQARGFIDLGFALGLGGAMTYARALQIRRHATDTDLDHLVLETDAPDIPPAWLHEPERRNTPGQLPRIAAELAVIRHCAIDEVARRTTSTARRVLPRLAAIC